MKIEKQDGRYRLVSFTAYAVIETNDRGEEVYALLATPYGGMEVPYDGNSDGWEANAKACGESVLSEMVEGDKNDDSES